MQVWKSWLIQTFLACDHRVWQSLHSLSYNLSHPNWVNWTCGTEPIGLCTQILAGKGIWFSTARFKIKHYPEKSHTSWCSVTQSDGDVASWRHVKSLDIVSCTQNWQNVLLTCENVRILYNGLFLHSWSQEETSFEKLAT